VVDLTKAEGRELVTEAADVIDVLTKPKIEK